ncbi:hypothetical protein [Streptomyces sp. NPDC048252]|uniref:hypothetical protein n=1 Tax=Streptomyces sp. NPDC048252 TaxID=3154612 RepID=UPI00342FA3DE
MRTLTLALQQTTSCLHGIGAVVHRCDAIAGGRLYLHLEAATGLTSAGTDAWAELSSDNDVAPTRAVGRGALVWMAGDSLGTGAAGTVAVPLQGAAGPIGALSVFTSQAVEPEDVRQSFLRSVAAWASAAWRARRAPRRDMVSRPEPSRPSGWAN